MADQKKDKPKVDVRDLKPNKDAKGGYRGPAAQGTGHQVQSGQRVQSSGRSTQ